jgi:hypothetical protein
MSELQQQAAVDTAQNLVAKRLIREMPMLEL